MHEDIAEKKIIIYFTLLFTWIIVKTNTNLKKNKDINSNIRLTDWITTCEVLFKIYK